MSLNGKLLIRLPTQDTRENYLDGFWRWVAVLANGDYPRAIEALYWPKGTTWTPHTLKERVTTFFGGDKPWSVVIPNDRLVGVINDAAETETERGRGRGWFLAQIPLTNEPADPKNDEICLMGLAVSFGVREHEGAYVLNLEMFHA